MTMPAPGQAKTKRGRPCVGELDRVDVAPLREAVQASGVSLSELAVELGMFKGGTRWACGDTSRLARMLGLKPHLSGAGVESVASTISYEKAVAIVRALTTRAAVDFVDVGV